MIEKYLSLHINEQIERSLYLKSLIPRKVYPELIGLADRCGRILDENINYLRFLSRQIELRENDDVRDLYRSYRVAYRDIETVEYFGIPALHFQTDSSKFFNKLIFGIKNEINLPFVAPSVACFSSAYYWVHSTTNVMFMPIGEANSLLHLPDVFHELGHSVLFNKDNDPRLQEIKNTYSTLIAKITEHFEGQITKKQKRTGPSELPMIIRHLHSEWKGWLNEFFSDLFACYTLGPAYAWANLHLTTKKCDDVYKFEMPPVYQTHPSDDSRMQLLELGLNKLGFLKEAREIRLIWDSMPFVTSSSPVYEYQYAYPRSLMQEIADLVFNSIKNTEIAIVTPDELEKMNQTNIRKILNQSWDNFWSSQSFREWEIKALKSLNQLYP